MKPAPVFLLVDGEACGPYEVEDVLDKIENGLNEGTLSCIEGMKGWRILSETLIYAYAKMLPALPQAEEWIKQAADLTINVRDGNREIRKTLKLTTGVEHWDAPAYLWQVIDTNATLLRSWRDYQNREQHWHEASFEFYPLVELVPFHDTSRLWAAEWQAAGGMVSSNRMMARKDDPCWSKFSDFGYPFPPFCFGRCGHVNDISSTEAFQSGFVFDAGPIRLPVVAPFKIAGL